MQKKYFFVLMLCVAIVDLTTITTVTVYASSQEEKVLRRDDVGSVHIPEEVTEVEAEFEAETELTLVEEPSESEFDDEISTSIDAVYGEMILGDYVYHDTDGDLLFQFKPRGEYAGFFDDSNPNVTDYVYEINTADSEDAVLSIYNKDKTAMVSYYLVFSSNYEDITLIYTGDASLKLHLSPVGALQEEITEKTSEDESTSVGSGSKKTTSDDESTTEKETEKDTEKSETDDDAKG